MNSKYIAVLDSGIGGFSVLEELLKVMPNENYLYFGDSKNAPYGNKTFLELINLVVNNIFSILPFGIKGIVFACNTISTTIFNYVKDVFPDIQFFAVYPPVEINLLRKRKTLLLCTPNTAKNFKDSEHLTVLPLSNLALEIERNCLNLEKVEVDKHVSKAIIEREELLKNNLTTFAPILTTKKLKMIFDHQINYFDAVILGCTHYYFVKNQIFNHFRPQVLLGGEHFTVRQVKGYYKKAKTLVNYCQSQVLFFGENAFNNSIFFKKFSMFRTKNIKII
jgi:glutamate racemase